MSSKCPACGGTRRTSLNPKDLQVLAIVEACRAELGFAPTGEEIARRLAVSVSRVTARLDRLRADGYATSVAGKARTLAVVQDKLTADLLALFHDLVDDERAVLREQKADAPKEGAIA